MFMVLLGFVLSGCLEKVDPISGIDGSVAIGSATLNWQPPTQNADGTPLTDLAGYYIYVGTRSASYEHRQIKLDNPGLASYVVDNLAPGTYYIAATAYNSSGVESRYSQEVVRIVR